MTRTFLLVGALAAALGAPAVAQDDTRVLRVVPYTDLQTLDPIVTTAGIVQSHGMMVYDFLFGRDAQQMPQPQMVEGWSVSEDGLAWSFTLRDGLAFHDGAPVTTADVVASLQRWGARDPYGRQLMAVTVELAAADARTLRWTLREPYGLMLEALSKSGGNIPAIMPARVAAQDPAKAIEDATGSGPFVFVKEEWQPGSKVVYRRNEAYVPRAEPASGTAGGKVVKVDRVEWTIIRDAQTAVFALVNGEVDFLENPAADFLPILEAEGLRTVVTNKLGFQGMLRMNHLHPPFDHPKAREALLWLVNQEDHLRVMFGAEDRWRVCWAFFVCGSPLESDAGIQPGFGKDPERARALLAEAGYKGEPIVILNPTDVSFMTASTIVLAEQLKAVGVNVDLQAMDFAAMAQRRRNRNPPAEGGWHLGSTYWNGLGASDPIGNQPMLASCDKAWPGWPCDAEHQALIDAYPKARTLEERKALAARIQESAFRLVPYVPLGQWFAPVAHSPRLEGLLGAPQVMVFWNVEKKPKS